MLLKTETPCKDRNNSCNLILFLMFTQVIPIRLPEEKDM